MNKLKLANNYIYTHQSDIKSRPVFHFTAPIGWLNDPNGFSFFKDNYHLFYQYHPYTTKWGPMHWGHAKSADLIKWEHLPVALAPDQNYDCDGCFSGSAIVVEDKLCLMYTGNINPLYDKEDDLEKVRQNQNLAFSEDGVGFTKYENNPIIDEKHLPNQALPQDFRDPKVSYVNGNYYAFIASKDNVSGGQILCYRSKDCLNWAYHSVMFSSENKLGTMWECPDLFTLNIEDPQEALILSIIDEKAIGPKHTTQYFIGNMNYEEGTYDWKYTGELDCGFSFYAPQTMEDAAGRRIMIAWLNLWESAMPTAALGWSGMMTVPRVLTISNNKLYQYPVEEIKNYRRNPVCYENITFEGVLQLAQVSGRQLDLEMILDVSQTDTFGIKLQKGKACETYLMYDCNNAEILLDRSKNGEEIIEPITAENEYQYIRRKSLVLENHRLKMRVLVDKYSLEIFINDGEMALSSTVFPHEDGEQIEFCAKGATTLLSLEKYDIVL